MEVDTWTGNWRFVRAAYCHDSGFVINPLLGEADMAGSLNQATQLATEAMPWDREFPGTRHYSVGYLSYRLPTIMDIPEVTNVFVNSLEPRWFFGGKGLRGDRHRGPARRDRERHLQCVWRSRP